MRLSAAPRASQCVLVSRRSASRPSGVGTQIRDISTRGLMAVTCDDGRFDGAVTSYAHDGTTWAELAVSGAVLTAVTRVNYPGQFAGYYLGEAGREHGFIAHPAGPSQLVQR
jgi:hypothetical protein